MADLDRHGDRGGGSVLSQKLSDAYCVLADEQRRRLAYDLFGSTGDIF